ncbi:DUF268 domain-containing protein [Butyrivibrio proteoclasticus]|uniref:DUF268 domain-containing protein n=1 Tax=Butyrivibrio proteoclasticus TaxID=43305 RepID=UPI0006870D42|nr:DUF268 domain-containing protein [Butyrivibrio proteoclasticus]
MPDITFWVEIRSSVSAEGIIAKLESICTLLGNWDEYEVIVINYVDSCLVAESFEQKYSENVMLIKCDRDQEGSAIDVMLDYAKGLTFLEVTENMEISDTMFDKLLYDENICDMDNFRYIRDKYTYMILAGAEKSSFDYLSSLHELEHIELGRYGDPLDYTGWKKALHQYNRVLKKNGLLLLSAPVGSVQRVCLNAHRVFEPLTIIEELAPDMRLLEFTFIHDTKRTTTRYENNEGYAKMYDVIENLTRTRLGEYDCGIFIFERQ